MRRSRAVAAWPLPAQEHLHARVVNLTTLPQKCPPVFGDFLQQRTACTELLFSTERSSKKEKKANQVRSFSNVAWMKPQSTHKGNQTSLSTSHVKPVWAVITDTEEILGWLRNDTKPRSRYPATSFGGYKLTQTTSNNNKVSREVEERQHQMMLQRAADTLEALYIHGLAIEATILDSALKESGVHTQLPPSSSSVRQYRRSGEGEVESESGWVGQAAAAWIGEHVKPFVPPGVEAEATSLLAFTPTVLGARALMKAHIHHGRWRDAILLAEQLSSTSSNTTTTTSTHEEAADGFQIFVEAILSSPVTTASSTAATNNSLPGSSLSSSASASAASSADIAAALVRTILRYEPAKGKAVPWQLLRLTLQQLASGSAFPFGNYENKDKQQLQQQALADLWSAVRISQNALSRSIEESASTGGKSSASLSSSSSFPASSSLLTELSASIPFSSAVYTLFLRAAAAIADSALLNTRQSSNTGITPSTTASTTTTNAHQLILDLVQHLEKASRIKYHALRVSLQYPALSHKIGTPLTRKEMNDAIAQSSSSSSSSMNALAHHHHHHHHHSSSSAENGMNAEEITMLFEQLHASILVSLSSASAAAETQNSSGSSNKSLSRQTKSTIIPSINTRGNTLLVDVEAEALLGGAKALMNLIVHRNATTGTTTSPSVSLAADTTAAATVSWRDVFAVVQLCVRRQAMARAIKAADNMYGDDDHDSHDIVSKSTESKQQVMVSSLLMSALWFPMVSSSPTSAPSSLSTATPTSLSGRGGPAKIPALLATLLNPPNDALSSSSTSNLAIPRLAEEDSALAAHSILGPYPMNLSLSSSFTSSSSSVASSSSSSSSSSYISNTDSASWREAIANDPRVLEYAVWALHEGGLHSEVANLWEMIAGSVTTSFLSSSLLSSSSSILIGNLLNSLLKTERPDLISTLLSQIFLPSSTSTAAPVPSSLSFSNWKSIDTVDSIAASILYLVSSSTGGSGSSAPSISSSHMPPTTTVYRWLQSLISSSHIILPSTAERVLMTAVHLLEFESTKYNNNSARSQGANAATNNGSAGNHNRSKNSYGTANTSYTAPVVVSSMQAIQNLLASMGKNGVQVHIDVVLRCVAKCINPATNDNSSNNRLAGLSRQSSTTTTTYHLSPQSAYLLSGAGNLFSPSSTPVLIGTPTLIRLQRGVSLLHGAFVHRILGDVKSLKKNNNDDATRTTATSSTLLPLFIQSIATAISRLQATPSLPQQQQQQQSHSNAEALADISETLLQVISMSAIPVRLVPAQTFRSLFLAITDTWGAAIESTASSSTTASTIGSIGPIPPTAITVTGQTQITNRYATNIANNIRSSAVAAAADAIMYGGIASLLQVPSIGSTDSLFLSSLWSPSDYTTLYFGAAAVSHQRQVALNLPHSRGTPNNNGGSSNSGGQHHTLPTSSSASAYPLGSSVSSSTSLSSSSRIPEPVFHISRALRVLLEAIRIHDHQQQVYTQKNQNENGSVTEPSSPSPTRPCEEVKLCATGPALSSRNSRLSSPLAVPALGLGDLVYHLVAEGQEWTLTRVLAGISVPGSVLLSKLAATSKVAPTTTNNHTSSSSNSGTTASSPLVSTPILLPHTVVQKARDVFEKNAGIVHLVASGGAGVSSKSSSYSGIIIQLLRSLLMSLPESQQYLRQVQQQQQQSASQSTTTVSSSATTTSFPSVPSSNNPQLRNPSLSSSSSATTAATTSTTSWILLLRTNEQHMRKNATSYMPLTLGGGRMDVMQGKRLSIVLPMNTARSSVLSFPWSFLGSSSSSSAGGGKADGLAISASDDPALSDTTLWSKRKELVAENTQYPSIDDTTTSSSSSSSSVFGDAIVTSDKPVLSSLSTVTQINSLCRNQLEASPALATLLLPELMRHGAFILPPVADQFMVALASSPSSSSSPPAAASPLPEEKNKNGSQLPLKTLLTPETFLFPLLSHLRAQAAAVLGALPRAVAAQTSIPATGGGLTSRGVNAALESAVNAKYLVLALEILDEMAPLISRSSGLGTSSLAVATAQPRVPGPEWTPDIRVVQRLQALSLELQEPLVASTLGTFISHIRTQEHPRDRQVIGKAVYPPAPLPSSPVATTGVVAGKPPATQFSAPTSINRRA